MTEFVSINETLRQIYQRATAMLVGSETPGSAARKIQDLVDAALAATGGEFDQPKIAPSFLITAKLSFTPYHDGNGFGWGGDAIVTFGHATGEASDRMSVNFGSNHDLAQKIVDRLGEQ